MATSEVGSGAKGAREVDPSLVTYTHVIYALHAASILVGVVGAASIVGSFLFGVPSIVAVVMNYVRRGDVAGSWLESHFRWQIRTFWVAFAVSVVAAVLMVTIILIPVSLGIFFVVALWVIYRVVRGWLALREGRELAG